MDKVKKTQLVNSYSSLLNSHSAIFFIRNSGLSVSESRFIRSKLKQTDTRLIFVKNNLLKKSLQESHFPELLPLIRGPIAIALSYYNDPVIVSRLLIKICSDHVNVFNIVAGYVTGKILAKQDIIKLSQMLTLDEIRIKTICTINSIKYKLFMTLHESTARLTRVLKVYTKK